MIPAIMIGFGALVVVFIVGLASVKGLIYICAPNEVLIFSGGRTREGKRSYGYRLIKGGRGVRWPMLERVDRMDLTNMVIDIQAVNAYSKGGIPLTVQGVANVKIAGHEPLIHNAIERFLGKSRQELIQIAKATLEGSLRGILATMTPEQVNADNLVLADRLVQEVEQDMTSLGLVVDTLKIQNVQDEVKYLDSLGRKRNADVIATARTAEAVAQADAEIQKAENTEKQKRAQIEADTSIAKADAQKRLTETLTRRTALVAEEQSQVFAAVAQARADLEVQKARLEQVRNKMEADVVAPAKANAEAAEANAKAQVATIVEEGRARAEALRKLAETYRQAGPHAREVLLTQKLNSIIGALTDIIPPTTVEKVTMIDSRAGGGMTGRTVSTLEQIKQVFGVDLLDKINAIGASSQVKLPEPVAVRPTAPVVVPERATPTPEPAKPKAQSDKK
ncbi:MAG TPA: SPFH domain-containing protein [Fimbriimonadaceae bacterium]|nr:SPFH domain-containing protein [Fimbriimonadaceae bacterium]